MAPSTSSPHAPTGDVQFGPTAAEDIAALSGLRRRFDDWVRAHGAVEDRAEELAVVLSELVTNGLEHRPSETDPVEVAAVVEDGRVELAVSNALDPGEVMTRHDLDDVMRSRGRGLVIASALTDDLRVEARGERIQITAWARLTTPR